MPRQPDASVPTLLAANLHAGPTHFLAGPDAPRVGAGVGLCMVEVRGSGFTEADAFDRVWIDGRWIPDVEIVDDAGRRRVVDDFLKPG